MYVQGRYWKNYAEFSAKSGKAAENALVFTSVFRDKMLHIGHGLLYNKRKSRRRRKIVSDFGEELSSLMAKKTISAENLCQMAELNPAYLEKL